MFGDFGFKDRPHGVRQFNRSHGKDFRGFSDEAREMLQADGWTGNVRELKNRIDRALTLEDGDWITPEMLRFDEESEVMQPAGGEPGILASCPGGLRELENRMLVSALEQARWNQVRAAEMLGIGRDALRYRMRKHGLL